MGFFFHVHLCMWAQVFKRLILPLLLHLCLPSSFFSGCFHTNQNTSGASPTSYAVHSRFFPSDEVLRMWRWPLISIHRCQGKETYTSIPVTPLSLSCTSSLSAHVSAGSYILHLSQTPLIGWHLPERAGRNTTAGRLGEDSRDSIATIRGTSSYGRHTAPPLLYL